MEGPPLRFGIIGLGFASTYTIPALATHPRVQIVAGADPRPQARARFAREFDGDAYETAAELCASPRVDAVYIATPNELHAEQVAIAAEHRKHVIVEKPMAITMDQCEATIAAAERNRVVLMCGHTHAFDPPIRAMRALVRSGELGRLVMMHTWNYTDLLYRPRTAWELDTAHGGGAVWVQSAHQVEMLRLIGGGKARSVRAMTGAWEKTRPTEGNYVSYLEFEDGTPATMVYSGYAHFDTAELHYWIGERGQARAPESHGRSQAEYRGRGDVAAEEALREARRYGGQSGGGRAADLHHHQHLFGLTVVSCERGDLRQSPDGLYLYGEQGKQEIVVTGEPSGIHTLVDEFCEAIESGRAPVHDGRWGAATVEVCLAILQSARERREVLLSHQVALAD